MEIISKDLIKPTSPTPNHLKFYEYSFFDQTAPPTYIPMLWYYPSPPHLQHNQKSNAMTSSRSKHLKKSLSEVLAHFYPLAGRLRDTNDGVDCNDEGVPFVEAFVHDQRLEDILKNPHENKLMKTLVPSTKESLNVLLLVQVTFFECGGMALGISATHKILDASSVMTLLTDWANLACYHLDPPKYVPIAQFIPPNKDLPPSQFSLEAFISNDPCVTNVYTFNPSNIAHLKMQATSETIPNPSRVEVVTSIIWKALTLTFKRSSVLTHVINMRTRVDPPMHSHHIGNFVGFYKASYDYKHENEEKDSNIVALLRKGLFEFENNEKLKGYEGIGIMLAELLKEGLAIGNNVDTYKFNSWCGFPYYDVDFGWGKPILFWPVVEEKMKNNVFFVDTKDGGVEAMLTLSDGDMKMFEKNTESQFLLGSVVGKRLGGSSHKKAR